MSGRDGGDSGGESGRPDRRGDRRGRNVSRRGFLAASGSGLAVVSGLAGCADLPNPFGGGSGDELALDRGVLRSVGRRSVPVPPVEYPGPVPERLFDAHRQRARELLDAVPESPEVPNGAATEQLRRRRERAAERLDAMESGGRGDDDEHATGARGTERRRTRLERLGDWRRTRSMAAEAAGAYRAATGDLAFRDLHDRLREARSARYEFLADWRYRGPSAAGALAVHREVEDLVDGVERDTDGVPSGAANPVADPFRVGEFVADLEDAEASLADARGLRDRYVENVGGDGSGGSETVEPREAALSMAAGWSGALARRRRREVDQYLEFDERVFDRDLSDSVDGELFRRAVDGVRWRRDDLGRDGFGDHASAVVTAWTMLAAVETLSTVGDGIRNDRYGFPSSADEVQSLRNEATAAIEEAWTARPRTLSTTLTWPALSAIDDGTRRLRESDDRRDVRNAVAGFVYARHYAETVPAMTTRMADLLDAADRRTG